MADKYPNVPWAKPGSPQTAFDAAESMKDAAHTIRASALAIVTASGPVGVIADEVAEPLGLHVSQVRSRLSELRGMGKIVPSGRVREGASGRKGTVWVLTQYGPPENDQGEPELAA